MTLIQRLDGTTYDLLDYGIRTRDVLISSPTPIHYFEEMEGRNGVIDYGTDYGARDITCKYRATSHDFKDFSLLRDEIFNIFRTEKSFYLIEKRLLGKRWLVKVADSYQIPQKNVYGNFDIDFIGINGMSESIGTTQDIEENGLLYNQELWSYGMGLEYDEESQIYTHDSDRFYIFNAGNVSIHPFEQELIIDITDVEGSVDSFELINKTTGDVFKVNEKVSYDRHIQLDGPNITRNGLQYFRKTNKEYITLAPGYNEFEINKAVKAKVKFDFRFYYK